MIETHPFGIFAPKNSQYLILGSFPGKIDDSYDWFYGSKRSQFWMILEEVYGVTLFTKDDKQSLFTNLKIAITDIILSCERKENNNLDTNLINIVINRGIEKVLKNNPIQKILFTSRFVENLFRKNFKDLIQKHPDIELITLPSPSPRYAAITKAKKIKRYKELLPTLTTQ